MSLVRLLEREGLDLGRHGKKWRERKERLGVIASEVWDRANRAFAQLRSPLDPIRA